MANEGMPEDTDSRYAPAVEQLLEYGVMITAGLITFAVASIWYDRQASMMAGVCLGVLTYIVALFLI
jgi:hypothetical protein